MQMEQDEVQARIESAKKARADGKPPSQLQVINLRLKGYEGETPKTMGEYNTIMESLVRHLSGAGMDGGEPGGQRSHARS